MSFRLTELPILIAVYEIIWAVAPIGGISPPLLATLMARLIWNRANTLCKDDFKVLTSAVLYRNSAWNMHRTELKRLASSNGYAWNAVSPARNDHSPRQNFYMTHIQ